MNEHRPAFAIMGSGGVGGYFGARLAQAGFPVTFIARGAHLAAIREHGLQVDAPEGSFQVDAAATDTPGDIGPVDFVIFSVKLWDTEEAGLACRPLIGADTAVISLQNGVDSETILQSLLGGDHVMGGVGEISAEISGPGQIRKISPFHRIRFGELARRGPERAKRLGNCLTQAGIEVEHSDDIVAAIWKKFIFLTGLSALTALTRKPIGDVRADADTRALLAEVMAEAVAIATASGIRLDDDIVADRLAMIDTFPAEVRASMALDLAEGRRLELPWLSGAVVRLGAERGVPTPANAFVATALKLHVDGNDRQRI